MTESFTCSKNLLHVLHAAILLLLNACKKFLLHAKDLEPFRSFYVLKIKILAYLHVLHAKHVKKNIYISHGKGGLLGLFSEQNRLINAKIALKYAELCGNTRKIIIFATELLLYLHTLKTILTMKYIASMPTMAPYLEQYVRHHGGELKDGVINLEQWPHAAHMLRRNLVYFRDESEARKKWPTMFVDDAPHVGIDSFRYARSRMDTDTSMWVLGPSGANEILEYLQALFDYALITDWTEGIVDYTTNTFVMPTKTSFVNSFCERHGINQDEREYRVVLKRMQRLLDRVEAIKNNQSILGTDNNS